LEASPLILQKLLYRYFLETFTAKVVFDIFYYAFAIYIVAAIESLLCSRMADRMANNKGIPFNPNKELWGQGMVNIFTPLFNGFPHTGALARTAVNIRLGAVSPLAGIAKFVFKLSLAAFLAIYLEQGSNGMYRRYSFIRSHRNG
jgi:MFS superfamily sulfate permease-like transporter